MAFSQSSIHVLEYSPGRIEGIGKIVEEAHQEFAGGLCVLRPEVGSVQVVQAEYVGEREEDLRVHVVQAGNHLKENVMSQSREIQVENITRADRENKWLQGGFVYRLYIQLQECGRSGVGAKVLPAKLFRVLYAFLRRFTQFLMQFFPHFFFTQTSSSHCFLLLAKYYCRNFNVHS